jgi:hypothetical protein
MLICAVASLALIIAGAVMLDWFRLTMDGSAVDRVAVDLHTVRACSGRICGNHPLGGLPGMYPTLATVTLWSSLSLGVLVAFQAGSHVLTGSAPESLTRLGYALALMAISLTVACAYLFGPEPSGVSIAVAARVDLPLHRTGAPLTLIVGLSLGFAAVYLAIARESSDLAAAYRPVTVDPAVVAEYRARQASNPIPVVSREQTGTMRAVTATGLPYPRERTGTMRAATSPGVAYREPTGVQRAGLPRPPLGSPGMMQIAQGSTSPPLRESTGVMRANLPRDATGATRLAQGSMGPPLRESTGAMRAPLRREQTGAIRAIPSLGPLYPREPREQSGVMRAVQGGQHPTLREATGVMRANLPRESTGVMRARDSTGVMRANLPRDSTGVMRANLPRDSTGVMRRTGPLPPMPDHLRNRLQYVALTADVTGGGVDARREDGLSRLVLWRDVVGVVARRLPPVYDGTAFVDIVSTAGSTLRIVPWTRLTGELVDVEGEDRTRAVVEHVLARCPNARLDPATQQFLDTGEPAQLPDLDTLRAHDNRLA